jgi:glycosyltransferase involved in cell wall biosynthesis
LLRRSQKWTLSRPPHRRKLKVEISASRKTSDSLKLFHVKIAMLRTKIVSLCWTITDVVLPHHSRQRNVSKRFVRYWLQIAKEARSRMSQAFTPPNTGTGVRSRVVKLRAGVRRAVGKVFPVSQINPMDALRETIVGPAQESVSIIVPTKNAGEQLWPLLTLLKNQQGFRRLEIIIVDSGSTDSTVERARQLGAKVVEILPEEYSHSYARNLGAQTAVGEYLLFTVQDALPPSDTWLYELMQVLRHNRMAAVSCAEYPRADADLFYRTLAWNHYRFLEVDITDRIMTMPVDATPAAVRKNGQLSNLACLISKDIFSRYQFRGNYAEDLELGVRLANDGHKIALLNSIRIIHSHNRPAYYHYKRGYVDRIALAQILPAENGLAIQPENMFRDILFIHEWIHSLVRKDLSRLTLPCEMKGFADFVIHHLHNPAVRYWNDPAVCLDEIPDSQLGSFLKTLYNPIPANGLSPYDGSMLGAMQRFVRLMLQYMTQTYEIVDGMVLDDFKSALYKACAFQCGSYMGNSVVNSSGETRTRLLAVTGHLAKDI